MIRRFCAILVGIALTWACAATGLFLLNTFSCHGCCGGGSRLHRAFLGVREFEQGLTQFEIDHDRCPRNSDELVGGGYVNPRSLVDPWGKSLFFTCKDGEPRASSAGPDHIFGTPDDVKNEH